MNVDSSTIQKSKKKNNTFLVLLKIVFFPIYFIYLVLKGIFKLIISIVKKIYNLLKNLCFWIFQNKEFCLVLLATIIFSTLLVSNTNNYIKKYNHVFITNKELLSSSKYMYKLNKKINKLSFKVNTLSYVKNTNVKVYSGKLLLSDNNFARRKRWKVNINSLIMGINTVDVEINMYNGRRIHETFYIYNTNKENLGKLDNHDTDGDKLLNYQEDIAGTDKNNKDTDKDGLSDYSEIHFSHTDPTKFDTDGNGINDDVEDFDDDLLSNMEELSKGTSVDNKDTDSDGLTDYDEIYKYLTNPIKVDSDGDGIADGLEVSLYLNPMEISTNVDYSKMSNDNMAGVVLKNTTGVQISNLNVEKQDSYIVSKEDSSYIAGPYNYSTIGNINDATISISFDSANLKENSRPTIYYCNEETGEIEELNTTVIGNSAYASVSHFSKYVLLDKSVIDTISSNAPKEDGSNVNKASLSTTEYIILSFPLLNVFGDLPIYIYKVGSPDNLDKIQTSFQAHFNNEYKVECKNISKMSAKLFDFIFSWSEENLKNRFDFTDEDVDTIKDKVLNKFIFYKHVYSSDELSNIIVGKNIDGLDDINEEKMKSIDSNNDGISDYYTKLICNGQLTTKIGRNPFGDVSYSDIQKSKDYDGDKLLNGDELEIVKENGNYYVIEHSSPIHKDTDGDKVSDRRDASPLSKFDDTFKKVKSLKYVPKTKIEDKLEKESNDVYDTEEEDYGSIVTRANMTVSLFGNWPAALALGHFMDNTGTDYSFDNDWGLLDTYRGKENLAKHTNLLMDVVEKTVKENDTLCFATKGEVTATNFFEHLEDISDFKWAYAVGNTRATIVSEAKNLGDGNYKMTLYYNVEDFYDWEGDANFITGFAGIVNDSEMYKLHVQGVAKQYRIHIPYKMEVTWKKGDRYYSDLSTVYLYETPESMIVNRLN